MSFLYCNFFFFFQAEDGIRDGRVTGVQTCALPICAPPVHFLIHPPESSYINAVGRAAVSPDGRHLTFVAPGSNGKDVLWVRSFDSLAARSLAGTDGALFPFWSPDSRWIGFFAHYSILQKIDITGGPPISVASALA